MAYKKYHNRKTVVQGITFDSLAEANRYCELCILERIGEIIALECQPTFLLLPAFKDCTGKKERAITYKADFRYQQDGRWIVEDVKSKATAKSRDWSLRRKLFKHRFPTIELREVAA